MAIYNCTKCNKRYFLDDNLIESNEFQSEFRCDFCGAGYNDTSTNDSATHTDTPSDSSSKIGAAIKVSSAILLVLCVIGSLIIIAETLALGIAVLITSVLFCLLTYGIGEIICLLKDINNKLK